MSEDDQHMLEDGSAGGEHLVRRFDTVVSTNDEAREWARAGAPHLSFVTAREQTGGRGRRGRAWASPSGVGFYGSMVARPNAGVDAASLLSRWTISAAVGVCRALSDLGLRAEVKWPNDVLLNGKKVAGILCEAEWSGAQPAFLVVGVGVNVSHRREQLPERPLFPASSLLLEAGRNFSLERAEEVLVPSLRAVAEEVEAGWGAVKADWESRCAGRGELVSVTRGGRKYFGVLRGIDESGALLLATADGVQPIVAGDVAFE